MRDFIIVILSIIVIALGVKVACTDLRIQNIEIAIENTEEKYWVVIAENEQLRRINDQNIRLLTKGGWDGLDTRDEDTGDGASD